MDGAIAVDGASLDQHLPGLAAVRAGVHAQRAADRSRYAAIEGEAGDARIRRGTRELGIGHDGPTRRRCPGSIFDLRETATETHDHPRHAAIAHQQIRAEPDHHHRDLVRQACEEIGKIGLVRRREQHLRRPADAKPRDVRQHRIGADAPAQLRHAGRDLRPQIGKAHAAPRPFPTLPAPTGPRRPFQTRGENGREGPNK